VPENSGTLIHKEKNKGTFESIPTRTGRKQVRGGGGGRGGEGTLFPRGKENQRSAGNQAINAKPG